MRAQWKSFAVVVTALLFHAASAHAQVTGPSSSQSPYIVPTEGGWEVTSLLTVGDAPPGSTYQMVGIPDGLGAIGGRIGARPGRYVSDRSYLTVFMNHELGPTVGAVRAHGQPGAFVSQWTVHLDSLRVTAGHDLVREVYTWNGAGYSLATGPSARFGRLCSADLPALTAFYNPKTGRGFNGSIFMNGEEVGTEGRGFAHVVSGAEYGRSYELPYLGRFSWENSLAHPDANDKTIVVGLDDSTPGQVYVYVGTKRSSGNPVERAGLVGGRLYGITVTDGGVNYADGPVPLENNGAIQDGRFTLVDVTAPAADLLSGAQLQARSIAAGVTQFARPEDGHWDTKDPRVFYFVTTGATLGGQTQTARLYRLRLNSLSHPTGGTIDLVVDSASLFGTDGAAARSFDNITVNSRGDVLVQEDPGGNPYIAKVWQIDPKKPREAVQIFESDRNRFAAGGTAFLTIDEENSGVIEVTSLVRSAGWYEDGRRYYLGVMQAHYPNGPVLVEGGQFYLMASADKHRPDNDDDDDDDDEDDDD